MLVGNLLFCLGTSSLLLLGTLMPSVKLNRTEGPFGFWSGPAFLQVKSCCRQTGLQGITHPALYFLWHGRCVVRDCPSGDRTGRSERPVAMGPVARHSLSPAPLGFLLQWTLGAIVCCDSKPTGKEAVSLTPHPLWCLLFWGGQEELLETSYFFVVCFCFSVLGAELRPSCKSFTAQQHP